MLTRKRSIRPATGRDAKLLWELNEEFNGEGCNTVSNMEKFLEENREEIVCLAELEGRGAGFCCARVMRSVCYADAYAKITELYVRPEYRRKGIGRGLLTFAEELCRKRAGVEEFQLLTGADNLPAQAFYRSMGYEREEEMLFVKMPVGLSREL